MDKAKCAAPCGLYCGTCPELDKACKGKPCVDHNGGMFWGKCDLYECCVKKKKLEHCGLCEEFPCKLFINHNDPSLSKEEAEKANKERQEKLKQRAKVGTKEWVKKFE